MRLWTSRLLISFVTVWNVQAAVAFIISPGSFIHAYELSGAAGESAVRGVGILFLMWNVPYVFAAINPIRYRLGLVFALLMQLTGLIGESYILSILPMGYETLKSSVLRFVIFDGTGLVLLLLAWLLVGKQKDATRT